MTNLPQSNPVTRKFLLGILGVLLLCVGFGIGAWSAKRGLAHQSAPAGGRVILYYVDPMNPAHTSDAPGLAPCGMKMEPVYADDGGSDGAGGAPPRLPGAVKITPEKQQLIGVRTAVVARKPLTSSLRLLGKVAVDETRAYRINATVDGWITRTFPVSTGSRVSKGQTLASFYSPEFLSAGQALLFALTSQDRLPAAGGETPQNHQIAQLKLNLQQYRDSLHNLGMGDAQIDAMIKDRKFASDVNIVSPSDGFITVRNVSDGLRFDQGTELFRIVDLRRVWILADVFDKDEKLVPPGTRLRVLLPQRSASFDAVVSDALPQFDPVTRTLKLRLEADNPDLTLKPDMFVDVEGETRSAETLVIPTDALLDSGLRKTVFVDCGDGLFEPRPVTTGTRAGDQVQILQGLMAGERIVVSGNFLLDSESRMKLAAAGVHRAPAQDPVCGMAVDEQKASAVGRVFTYQGKTYLFCCDGCKEEFSANPRKFLNVAPATGESNAPSPRLDQPHH